MKRRLAREICATLLALGLLTAAAPASAARLIRLPLDEALAWDNVGEKLEAKGIKVYWASQAVPGRIVEDIEEDVYTRGVNAFLKSDRRACLNAFSMAFDALIRNAVASGANAIISIKSYHDDYPDFASEKEFRCDVGSFRAGVGFRVHFVKTTDTVDTKATGSGEPASTTPPAPR